MRSAKFVILFALLALGTVQAQTGVCDVSGANCTTDADCPAPNVCSISGDLCIYGGCSTQADCPAGTTCSLTIEGMACNAAFGCNLANCPDKFYSCVALPPSQCCLVLYETAFPRCSGTTFLRASFDVGECFGPIPLRTCSLLIWVRSDDGVVWDVFVNNNCTDAPSLDDLDKNETSSCQSCTIDDLNVFPNACPTPICGNGILEDGEECDDNNTNANDGCSGTCTIEEGWECDNSYPSACQRLQCCFTGWTGISCNGTITLGPSTVDTGFCVNMSDVFPFIIAGVFAKSDDGITYALFSDSGCNNILEGDITKDDTCLNTGTNSLTVLPGTCPLCPNGVLDNGEECDDSNTQDGDGCSPNCTVETGWECDDSEPSVCERLQCCFTGYTGTTCSGNITLGPSTHDTGECVNLTVVFPDQPTPVSARSDDGVTFNAWLNQDCSGPSAGGATNLSKINDCLATGQNSATVFPGACPICGNGIVEPPEECDDGNDFAGDGCYKCFDDTNTACRFAQASCGNNDCCAVLTNGTGVCWGSNLGNIHAIPTAQYLEVNVYYRNLGCGIFANQSGVCWGDHVALYNIIPPPASYQSIRCGNQFACAVYANQTVDCFTNNSGRLAQGIISDKPTEPVESLDCGYGHCCVLFPNTTAYCWGNNPVNETDVPSSLEFLDITTGDRTTCGVLTDNSEVCFGSNSNGEVDVPNTTFIESLASDRMNCGRLADGRGQCWGLNDFTTVFQLDNLIGPYEKALCGLQNGFLRCHIVTNNLLPLLDVPTDCSATCGNGILESGEECDDGNLVDGDGCDMMCQNEGGACCFQNNTCVQLFEAECNATSGTYQGDGVDCNLDGDSANVCVDCDDNDDNFIGVTLILRKEVVNNNTGGPDRNQNEFTLFATAQSGGAITFFGNDTGSGVIDPNAPVFLPASWILSETLFPGYEADQWICVGGGNVVQGIVDGEATLNVSLSDCGAIITCTITNDDRPRGACCSDNGKGTVKVCENTVLESVCTNSSGVWTQDETCQQAGCCGDGVINGPNSECDDGNEDINDGCNSQCGCETPDPETVWNLDVDDVFTVCTFTDTFSYEATITMVASWVTIQTAQCSEPNAPAVCVPALPATGQNVICTCNGTALAEIEVGAKNSLPGCTGEPTAFDTATPSVSVQQCPDDGLFCTGVESCEFNGTDANCVADPPVCDDQIDCTIDSCNETTNQCDHLPTVNLTLRKLVTNDSPGFPNRNASEFNLSATALSGGAISFSGFGPFVSDPNAPIFPPASWRLNETRFPGYTPGTWFCDDGTLTDSSPGEATLSTNASACGDILCTITNDDLPRGSCCSNQNGRKRVLQFSHTCEGNILQDDCNMPSIWTNGSTCANAGCCGDGVINGGEDCDDGNINANDGCSATCTCESPSGMVSSPQPGSYCVEGEQVSVFFTVSPITDPYTEISALSCTNGKIDDNCLASLPSVTELMCHCKLNTSLSVETTITAIFTSNIAGCSSFTSNDSDTAMAAIPDCSDGEFCTGVETCFFNESGCFAQCVPGTPPNCDDGINCTVDSCNETSDDCDNIPNDGDCNDNLICNGIEFCNEIMYMGCQPGIPIDCNDNISCTDDFCVEPSNCTDACVSARDSCISNCKFGNLVCEADCKTVFHVCLIDCTGGSSEHCSSVANNTNCEEGEVCDSELGCDVDCNHNGISDTHDISEGTSQDENDNGVPDECDGCTYTQGWAKNMEKPPLRLSNWSALSHNCSLRAGELQSQCNNAGGSNCADLFILMDTMCNDLEAYHEDSYPKGNSNNKPCLMLARQFFAFVINTFLGGVHDLDNVNFAGAFVPDELLLQIDTFITDHTIDYLDVMTCSDTLDACPSDCDTVVTWIKMLAKRLDNYNRGEYNGDNGINGPPHCDSELECVEGNLYLIDDCSGDSQLFNESGSGDPIKSGDCIDSTIDPLKSFRISCREATSGTFKFQAAKKENCGGKKDQDVVMENICHQAPGYPDVYYNAECTGCFDEELADVDLNFQGSTIELQNSTGLASWAAVLIISAILLFIVIACGLLPGCKRQANPEHML